MRRRRPALQGDLLGQGSIWGYVEGGMGRISFAIAQAAQDAGAALAAGVPVARIVPGEGVELESGELIGGRTLVCNADPKRTLAMLEGSELPGDFRRRGSCKREDQDDDAHRESCRRRPHHRHRGVSLTRYPSRGHGARAGR